MAGCGWERKKRRSWPLEFWPKLKDEWWCHLLRDKILREEPLWGRERRSPSVVHEYEMLLALHEEVWEGTPGVLVRGLGQRSGLQTEL